MIAGIADRQDVDHRCGDARRRLVVVLLDHRRQEILRRSFSRIASSDGSTRRRQSPSRDPAGIEQIVEIDRLMGAVEIADAEVHDAGLQRRPPRRPGWRAVLIQLPPSTSAKALPAIVCTSCFSPLEGLARHRRRRAHGR
jgi:hypothetical protein